MLPTFFQRAIPSATVLALAAVSLSAPAQTADTGSPADQGLGIAELLHAVRSELIRSENLLREKKIPALFKTKELELELHFVVRQEADSSAGFSLWVITVGGEASYTTETIQKIRLLLEADTAPQTSNSGNNENNNMSDHTEESLGGSPAVTSPTSGTHPPTE